MNGTMDWNDFSLHFGSLHICNQWSLIASIGVYSMSVIVAGQLMDLSNVIISNVFLCPFQSTSDMILCQNWIIRTTKKKNKLWHKILEKRKRKDERKGNIFLYFSQPNMVWFVAEVVNRVARRRHSMEVFIPSYHLSRGSHWWVLPLHLKQC